LINKGIDAKCDDLRVSRVREGELHPPWAEWAQPEHYNHPLVEKRLSGLPAGTFGSFERIQLHDLFGTGLHVGGEITGAVFPLDLWFWAGLAINAF
jgi:hypothetical protein